MKRLSAFVVLALFAQLALAVKEGVFSWTAESCAAFRAIGSKNLDPKLRNPDHLAEKLVSHQYWSSAYLREHSQISQLSVRNPQALATYFYVTARTHLIDQLLTTALDSGVEQVVILGAGLDSRPYRFGDRFSAVRFFEVDLPWMIAEKIIRVEKAIGKIPPNVTLIGLDFNRESLAGVLPSRGYDPHKKTFFILEGITMYVNRSGNEATFLFMSAAAPGSAVVYDYVLDKVIKKDFHGLYATHVVGRVRENEEPYVTGWVPEAIDQFLAAYGFAKVEDLGDKELMDRFLTGSDGRLYGRPIDWHRLVFATKSER